MFIDTFIDKVKIALRNPTCTACQQKLHTQAKFCARCHEKLGIRQPEPILSTPNCAIHAATNLNPHIKRVLYGHKFHNKVEHVPQLAALLVQYWNNIPPGVGFQVVHPENVLVIPIPPHGGEASRVDMFASQFARHFGYDYRHDVLTWMREVKPQHRIHDKQTRLANIAQSLYLKSGIVSGYEKVIVVDDITTTGATLLEASRAFGNEAAHHQPERHNVVCLAVARVPLGAQIRTAEVD
ncbi:ComF family protein [Vampirovibrio sp.]|uniref:ComF family protein n=1 Tax=Vampirovibrio sp. TaxID=2717857 RepID=UPI003593269F